MIVNLLAVLAFALPFILVGLVLLYVKLTPPKDRR